MNERDRQKRITAKRRELAAMRKAFPSLPEFAGAADGELERIYDAYVALIPALHAPALAAQERSALTRLAAATSDPAIKRAAQRAIAESDIRSGMMYSTIVRSFPDLWQSVQAELKDYEAGYGAPIFSRTWKSYSRGNALILYFSRLAPELDGKRILHIAPEAEAAAWFKSNAQAMGVRYDTLNLGGDVSFVEDLTALELEDRSFDWVVCHRVLEHIFDDGAAIGEAFRILKPGGVFNVSVPESMHRPATDMWAIPDLSHHYHYRQYGADFAALLARAGFAAEVVEWMLKAPAETLEAAGTFPFRMYDARRT